MELQLQSTKDGGQTEPPCIAHDSSDHFFADDFDSTCSTPFVSAPSSPGRTNNPASSGGFFYSCPASPMHFAITSSAAHRSSYFDDDEGELDFEGGSRSLNEFEFSARFGSSGSGQTGSMSSADELFLNGKIRPMKLSSHLEKPQVLAPLLDLDEEEEGEEAGESRNGNKSVEKGYNGESRGRDLRLRNKSLRRRTRSMSPLRSSPLDDEEEIEKKEDEHKEVEEEEEAVVDQDPISISASSSSTSRSSSAGRNSKRWVFLKEFLYRSKSEGRSTNSNSNKFWSNISFSPAKEKKAGKGSNEGSVSGKVVGNGSGKKPVNGLGRKRVPAPSPHELHYKASRAQAEEMRKKTFLPYRQGLLGCLGFSSKGYGAMNGFARALNPVSSR